MPVELLYVFVCKSLELLRLQIAVRLNTQKIWYLIKELINRFRVWPKVASVSISIHICKMLIRLCWHKENVHQCTATSLQAVFIHTFTRYITHWYFCTSLLIHLCLFIFIITIYTKMATLKCMLINTNICSANHMQSRSRWPAWNSNFSKVSKHDFSDCERG